MRHLKGSTLLSSGYAERALPELREAARLLPRGYLPHLDLGRCARASGLAVEAREHLERARELLLEGAATASAVSGTPGEQDLAELLRERELARVARELAGL